MSKGKGHKGGGKSHRLPVRWEGSQFVHHSLAHVNREMCRELLATGKVDLEVVPFEAHEFTPDAGSPFAGVAACIGRKLGRPAQVHVRHQWPPRFDGPREGAWVIVQPWEYGPIPKAWVEPMRRAIDEVWVPTRWLREWYAKSGVPAEKVFVIPNGVDTERYRPEGARAPLRTQKRCKLLTLGGMVARKGIDILLEAYLSTFRAEDDVCLVIKGFGSASTYSDSPGHRVVMGLLEQARSHPEWPEIEYIPDTWTDDAIASLYRACDALVAPYRGEGFGMPIAEAMASELPVVVTGHGACLDFCDASTAYLIAAEETPVPLPHSLPEGSADYVWATPDRASLQHRMRHVVLHPDERRAVGRRARQRIVDEFRWDQCAARALERVRALAHRRPLRFSALAGARAT